MLTAKLFDASGSLILNAFLTNISNFTYNERLDEIGSFSLQMPLASVHGRRYVERASTIAVSENFEEFFRGVIDKTNRADATFRVTGSDLLEELRYPETGVGLVYNGALLPDVMDDLVALSPKGWTAITSTQSVRVATSFKGRQVFDAVRDLIRTYGYHVRRTSPSSRTIEIAPFGADTGYVLTNAPHLTHNNADQGVASVIGPLNADNDRTQIVNRVIAYGGTYSGTALQLPLENRTETETIVQPRTIGGQVEHYIQDAASITKYGVREKVVRFSEIIPSSTDTADVERAEDMLKARAVAFLSRWANPIVTYTITTPNFNRGAARVGDLVTLHYEEALGSEVISVNDTFYLTEVHGNFTSAGQTIYTLTLSNTNRVLTDDREAMLGALQRIEELKLDDIT